MNVYVRRPGAQPGTPLLRLDFDEADIDKLTHEQIIQLVQIINVFVDDDEANHGDTPCTRKPKPGATVRHLTTVTRRTTRFDA